MSKGWRQRTRDHDRYREGHERTFGGRCSAVFDSVSGPVPCELQEGHERSHRGLNRRRTHIYEWAEQGEEKPMLRYDGIKPGPRFEPWRPLVVPMKDGVSTVDAMADYLSRRGGD